MSLLASAVCLRVQETPAAAGASEGEKMERQMWADFKAKEWKVVESKSPKVFNLFIRMDRVTEPARFR